MIASDFLTESLKKLTWGESVCRILLAAIRAVDPAQAVHRYVQFRNGILHISDRRYHLSQFRRIYLVGAGKAALPMANALVNLLDERITSGIIIVSDDQLQTQSAKSLVNIEIYSGMHPIPDQRNILATKRVFELLAQTDDGDLVICLISGGGSALLTSPVSSVSLEDLQALTATLLASGADIREINVLRKHLDRAKGGNLARLISPACMVTLILSDVVGDPLDVIASGPTVPDPTTYQDALSILRKYDLVSKIPPGITEHLERGFLGEEMETPKPGDQIFNNSQHLVIGSNYQAASAALRQAQIEGFQTLLISTYLQGEARQVGRLLAAIARQIDATGQPLPRPACLVAGGETTVSVKGEGKGGRNQEVALGAVKDLDKVREAAIITLATDGKDGPTDAAGAVVTGETFERGMALGLDPQEHLSHNDAYHYFAPLGDLLFTGPTQTNVSDLNFLFLCR